MKQEYFLNRRKKIQKVIVSQFVPSPITYLWVIGFHQLALSQEELQIAPVHVRQQYYWLFPILYTDVPNGEKVPETKGKSLDKTTTTYMHLRFTCYALVFFCAYVIVGLMVSGSDLLNLPLHLPSLEWGFKGFFFPSCCIHLGGL